MNADLFRRWSSLVFALAYSVVGLVADSTHPHISLVFCLFSAFCLGIWLTSAATWRIDQAKDELIKAQRAVLELYRKAAAERSHGDDADWWKKS